MLDINTTDNTTYTAGNLINNATARIHNSSTTTNSFASLAFRTGSGDNAIGFKYTGTANQADFVIVNDGAANGNEVFRIDSSGNIKINGDSPYLYLSDNDNNWIRGSSSINAILFGTNNSESMRIDSSGRVGIGTTSPSTTLHLSGSADAYLTLQAGTTDGNDGILFKNSAGTQKGAFLYDTDDNYLLVNVNNSERMRIDSAGRLGLGTSSPSVLLHVKESTGAHANLILENSEGSAKLGTNSNVFYVESSQHIFYNSGGSTEYARIDGSGRLLLGTTTAATNAEVTIRLHLLSYLYTRPQAMSADSL